MDMETFLQHPTIAHVMLDITVLTVHIIANVLKPARDMGTVRIGEVVIVIKGTLDIDVVTNVILILVVVDMDSVVLQENASAIHAIMETNVSISVLEMVIVLETPVIVAHVSLVPTATLSAQDMDIVKTKHVCVRQHGKDNTVKYQGALMIVLEMVFVMVFYRNVSVILVGKVSTVVSQIVLVNLIAMDGVFVRFTMDHLFVSTVLKDGWGQHVMMSAFMVYSHQ